MSRLYWPEAVILHTPEISDPGIIMRAAGIPEPFNLHGFSIDPAEEFEDTPREIRARLEYVMEGYSLSHLLVQERLMEPMAGMVKLAIGSAYWYSPTQEGFVFGTFDDDCTLTEMSLERAKELANFVEIPGFVTTTDIKQE